MHLVTIRKAPVRAERAAKEIALRSRRSARIEQRISRRNRRKRRNAA
jgi:hypothetical protein